ncbi:MAG: hypothetical protein R3F61_29130 [Myxococcota bacterium]
MQLTKNGVRVERIGGALWIEADGTGLLIDAPAGTAQALGDRVRTLRSVLLLTGRLERVSGLVSVFGRLGRDADSPLVVRFPLSDERGATLAEAWQRSWGDYPITLDAVAPGQPFDIGPAEARSVALRDPQGDFPPLGVQIAWRDVQISVLSRCVRDGAARSICRGADLVICELGGGGLSAAQAVDLAGDAELWVEPVLSDV